MHTGLLNLRHALSSEPDVNGINTASIAKHHGS